MPGTITGTLTRVPTQTGRPQLVKIVLTCTADLTLHTWPTTVINTLANISDFLITGLKLYQIKCIPDAVTPPTTTSSVTITDEDGYDLLGNKGSGLLSNTLKTGCLAGPLNCYAAMPITGNISITLSGNSVDGAITKIILILTGD